MSAPAKLAGFAVALALVFAGATLAGGAIDADPPKEKKEMTAHSEEPAVAPAGHAAAAAGGQDAAAGEEHPVRGLAVAEGGLRLEVADPTFKRGARETLRFRIVREKTDRALREFDLEHTKRMHVIVVRRDLTGFQHLHPEIAGDGTWTTELTLDEAGSYRVFADFSHDGEPYTLASDLRVDGAAELQPLPRPATSAASDGGYDVELDAHGDELSFTITRDGEPVEVEPYLGANGHLVALREGDLAFLHVHPEDEGVTFAAEFPTAGRYRLFLQFQVDGRVETVAFTHEVR
jgi:hypothetical protein